MRPFVLIVVLVFLGDICRSAENLILRDISIRDGLSNLDVRDIVQDEHGYVWIATMRGLNRFNGYTFTNYGFMPDDSTSLRSSQVLALHIMSNGTLLVGSTKGLDCYDPRKEQFSRALNDYNSTLTDICEINGKIFISADFGVAQLNVEDKSYRLLASNRKSSLTPSHMFVDSENNLWCTFYQSPIFARYDPLNDRFEYFNIPKLISTSTSSDYVTSILPISSHMMLVGTSTGVLTFNPQDNRFVCLPEYDLLSRTLRGKMVRMIMEKNSQVYWIGTLRDGLFLFDKYNNTIEQYKGASDGSPSSFVKYYVDKDRNVWFGSDNAGIKVHFEQGERTNFNTTLNRITQNKFISHITKDRKGELLISTREYGYYVYNLNTGLYSNINANNSALINSRIRTMYADSRNNYWIGLYSDIQMCNTKTKKYKNLIVPTPNVGASVFCEANGLMLAGCEGHGILVYDLEGNFVKQMTDFGSHIVGITQLNDRQLLLLSALRGVYVMDINTLKAEKLDLKDRMFDMSLRDLITMYVDRSGVLWVGAYNYGLFEIDMDRLTVKNYNTTSALPSNDVLGISEDRWGNMWISTSLGLARMNIKNKIINVFEVDSKVGNYQFHRNAVHKDRDGVIYFGGNAGLTYLQPDVFESNGMVAPKVVLESISVLNHKVKAGDSNSLLSKALPFTECIELSHRDKMISIDFVSPEFLSPHSLQYFYMLEGFDKEWINAGSQRKAVYSNLSAGNYTFRVKVCNKEGVWSDNDVALHIHVNPPIWWTWWAWCIYVLFCGMLTYIIFKLMLANALYRKELNIEVYEHGLAEESHLMKRRFFTNIAHELRTPLTMILGMVKQLASFEGMQGQQREIVSYLDVSVLRLLKLINQLLDFKNLENDTLSLWLKKGDINNDIKTILQPYSIFTGEKNIKISMREVEHVVLYYDMDKIEKILSNLLFNAIKHTDQGRIEVVLTKITMAEAKNSYLLSGRSRSNLIDNFIEISVSDTGEGVDHQLWTTIFERYVKGGTRNGSKANYASTGVGLNFSKSLVELHHGTIKVSDTPGGGATFSFIVPYESEVYDVENFATEDNIDEGIINMPYSQKQETVNIVPDFDKTIMVVEDDPQINRFIKDNLKPYYKVITAFDGSAALELLNSQMPDVIISDVMMPRMDGLEMIKNIRENPSLNHIVIIVLSAKSEVEDQISGLELGANLYLPKPIQINHLLAIVDSQLKNRQRVSELFLNGLMPSLNKSTIGKQDMEFLVRLNKILEAELSNTDLGIALIADKLNMSRSSFHRKFISVTDIMPNVYIKKYRINRAIEYMSEGRYSMNDIVDMVGFSSTSYFSTVFKHEKQISPSDYLKKLRNENQTE